MTWLLLIKFSSALASIFVNIFPTQLVKGAASRVSLIPLLVGLIIAASPVHGQSIWSAGMEIDIATNQPQITDINTRGEVAGQVNIEHTLFGFVLTPKADGTYIEDINPVDGFNDLVRQLPKGAIGDVRSHAIALNNAGDIIGESTIWIRDTGLRYGVLWPANGDAPIDVGRRMTTMVYQYLVDQGIDIPFQYLSPTYQVVDINDHGFMINSRCRPRVLNNQYDRYRQRNCP